MARNTSVHKLALAVGLAGWGLFAGCSHFKDAKHDPAPCPRPAKEQPCPAWRWIGILEDAYGSCPQLPGWRVRPLFGEVEPLREPAPGDREETPVEGASGRTPAVPPGLRRFCLYEHPGAGAELRAAALGLAAVGRDCMAVFPAASRLAGPALAGRESRFRLQAAGQRVVPAPPAGPPPVRLALLDTAPTSGAPAADPRNHSPHGYTLANMAKKLGCGGGRCVAEVTARLALPWLVYDPRSRALSLRDDAHGGFMGLIGELAEAIRGEVAAWDAAPAGPRSLVLNLSLGWNPLFGGLEGDASAMPPAVQAVHAALVDAACRGVPAIAASGNLTWGADPGPSRGPLLPAAWERRAAPDEAACLSALGTAGAVAVDDASGSPYRPLVHAVGAVDAGDAKLANARLAAEPRLVAFGDHGLVAGEGDGGATATLTGSSVSTLVAATALAWVRAYRQDLDAFEAVDVVHGSGKETGRPAGVCVGAADACRQGSAPPVRRVLVAKAAAAACAACAGPRCAAPCPRFDAADLAAPAPPPPAVAAPECRPEWTVRLADLAAVAPETSRACPPPAWQAALQAERRNPAAERFHGARRASSRRCPHWQLVATDLQAMTGPQPGSDPCPSCGLGGGGGVASARPAGRSPVVVALVAGPPAAALGAADAGQTLYLEIDDRYLGALSSPVLRIGDDAYALAAVWPDLGAGARLCILGVPAAPRDPLQVSFVVNGTRSATSLLERAE